MSFSIARIATAATAVLALASCEALKKLPGQLKKLPFPSASVGITGVTPSGDTWFAGIQWPPATAKTPAPVVPQK